MSTARTALALSDSGHGLPIAFLHGYLLDRTFWSPLAEVLGPGMRSIVPDLPGFGESPVLPGVTTLDAMADRVVQCLDALKVERAAIVGLSMGGYVALALWRRHPTRVRALVLADTRAVGDTLEGRTRRDQMISMAERDGAEGAMRAMMPNILGATTRASRPKVVAAARAMMLRQPVNGIVAALRMMRDRPDQTPVLATLTVPTLCLVGEEDAITTPTEMTAMTAAISGGRLVHIPASGHLAPFETPEAVADELRPFLGGLG
ncbi:MAG: alpha/beta fold hydrolase [Gemmatimonadetes bacterium]|nr:alpha/beta fold hydrolase [Gemmatimonadota bacterium]